MTEEERIEQLEAENAALRGQLAEALERIHELEGQLAKDSHNSSKPLALAAYYACCAGGCLC